MELRRTFRVRAIRALTAAAPILAALFGVSALLTAAPTAAVQTVPYLINFQGRLTDNNGNVLSDGSYNVKFRIFDAATAGTNLWEGDRVYGASDHRITVQNGLFNIQFGDTTQGDPALSPSLFNTQTHPSLYLEVELPTPATSTCASNGCASWTEGAMTPRQPLASATYAFNSDTLDGLDSAAFVQLSVSQQTGSINVSGNITSGGALQVNSATIQGSNALTLGSTTASGGILLQDGTVNNYAVTLATPALAGSYQLTLPTTGATNAQCLVSTGTSTTVSTALQFASCTGTIETMQAVYNASSSPANITLANAKDFTITAADTASDPNVLINLQCVTSCGSNGRFAVQSGGTDVFTVNPNGGAINIGATGATALSSTVNVGTSSSSSNAQAVTIGSNIGASATSIEGGSNGNVLSPSIAIGNSAVNHVIEIGSNSLAVNTVYVGSPDSTSVTTISAGTGNINLSTSGSVSVSTTTAPTVDQVKIDNSGSAGVTTANTSGLHVNYKGGAAAVESSGIRVDYAPGATTGGTWSGLRIVGGSSAASGVTSYGLKIDGLGSTGSGTDEGLYVGANWDIGIDLQSGGIQLAAQSDPTTPASGNLRIYAKTVAGRTLPKWKAPSGVDTPFQASFGFNRVAMMAPAGNGTTATTIMTSWGNTFTNSANTFSDPALASTNLSTSVRRARIQTATNSTTAIAYHAPTALMAWRGNAAGLGGFFFTTRFNLATLNTNNRAFVGLVDSTTAPTSVDPTTSTTFGKLGLAINTNSGNWNWVNNVAGTAPTVTGLGASYPVNATDLYELIIFSPPNGSSIIYRVQDISTGAVTADTTVSTNIPANTSFLAPQYWIADGGTTGAAAIDNAGWYLESDN